MIGLCIQQPMSQRSTFESRTNVDVVESDFVRYKGEYPEVREELVPTLVATEPFPARPIAAQGLSDPDLEMAKRLAPWGYSFTLAPDLTTDDVDHIAIGAHKTSIGHAENAIRRSMLAFAMARFAPEGTWLDLATNCGIIPMTLADRKSYAVTGIDLVEQNVEKANFLRRLGGFINMQFYCADVYDFLETVRDSRFEIISAHGLFYHLSDPIGLATLMFRKTRKVIMIETTVHNFPFSGWLQTVSRFVKYPELAHANDTRKIVELHPTYRGLTDTLFQVGFESVFEVKPGPNILAANPGTIFDTGNRRLLVAVK
jgi:hypothetical protein